MSFERRWQASYPAGVPREIEFEQITMPEILSRTASRFPNQTAIIFMGKKFTYRELEVMVNKFAQALREVGVKAGDKVVLLMPNMPQFVIAYYAALRIGATTVLHNPLSSEEELTDQVRAAGATVLVTMDLLYALALTIKEQTGIRSIVACHITDYLPFPGNKLLPYLHPALYHKIEPAPGVYEFLALLAKYPDAPVENSARWEDVAVIIHTEGTTGPSKGVMLTHANIACNTRQLRAWLSALQDGRESMLATFSFFHHTGLIGILNLSTMAGWTDILVPHPDPRAIIEIAKKHKPTLLPVLPALQHTLVGRPEFRRINFSALKGFISAAAPLPAAMVERLKSIKNVPVIDLYGLTEISAAGTATPWSGKEKPGTVGVPLPGTDLRIVDAETGSRELPPGEAGEICFRGPQVMAGYDQKPGETETALKDGWLFSGDIGFVDEDGYLTLRDRKKDLISVDGQTFYLAEIDAAICSYYKVFDSCSVGVPDDRGGKTVKSYVVLKPKVTATVEEIIAQCGEILGPTRVPKAIEFVNALPKSAMGKILRREVREIDKKRRQGVVKEVIPAMTDRPDTCIGLIADSHGNLDATAEAIRLLQGRGADVIVHLGDFLDSVRSTGAAEMISLLRENRVVTVKGNNDFLVERVLGDERRRPGPADDGTVTFLRSVPITRTFDGLLFAHSLPFDSLRSFYEPIDTGNTQRATRLFAETEFELLFCGHSHLPIMFRKAGSRVTREEVPTGVKLTLHTPGAAPGSGGGATIQDESSIDRDRFIIVVGAADDGECALYDRGEGVYERVTIGAALRKSAITQGWEDT